MLGDVDIQFSFDDGSEVVLTLDSSSLFATPDTAPVTLDPVTATPDPAPAPTPAPDLTPPVDPNAVPPAPDGGASHGPAPIDPSVAPAVSAVDDAAVVLNIDSSLFDSSWTVA